MGRVRAVPRLCVLYPGICLTTEEKYRKTSVKTSYFVSLVHSVLALEDLAGAIFSRSHVIVK